MAKGELSELIGDLRLRRAKLSAITEQGSTVRLDELVADISELTQELLAADEELRAQQEQLDTARAALAAMTEAQEARKQDPEIPRLVTDQVGVITWRNAAAEELCQLLSTRVARPITTRFSVPDRSKVRTMITNLSRATPGTEAEVEACLARPDGAQLPTRVRAAAAVDPVSGARTLRWELLRLDQPPRLRAISQPAAPESAQPAVVSALHKIGEASAADADVSELCRVVLGEATKLVAAADHAALLIQQGNKVVRLDATSDTARAAVELQQELRQGPIPTAVTARVPQRLNVADAGHQQWPLYAQQAGAMRILSEVTVPFAARTLTGVLSLFSSRPAAFGEPTVALLTPLANQGVLAIAQKTIEENLRAALPSHRKVGMALGILIERHRLTEETAFNRLVRISQQRHVKLRTIAETIVETGQDPELI